MAKTPEQIQAWNEALEAVEKNICQLTFHQFSNWDNVKREIRSLFITPEPERISNERLAEIRLKVLQSSLQQCFDVDKDNLLSIVNETIARRAKDVQTSGYVFDQMQEINYETVKAKAQEMGWEGRDGSGYYFTSGRLPDIFIGNHYLGLTGLKTKIYSEWTWPEVMQLLEGKWIG